MTTRWREKTYYASPPQIPSRLMRMNTITMPPTPSFAFEPSKMPTADSSVRVSRMTAWVIAGRGRNRVGSAGTPREMEERERKTEAWYTSCLIIVGGFFSGRGRGASADHVAEEGWGRKKDRAHLPERVVIPDGVDYLAQPGMVLCFRDWVEKGRCYALIFPRCISKQ
jgi:hypothetical protein